MNTTTPGERIARLRVAVETGRLPRDLGEELLALLSDAPRRRGILRTRRRNDLLRQAAALVTGSAWAKATRLHRELTSSSPQPDDADGVRALVLRAVEADRWGRVPCSVRQIYRVLMAD